MSPFPPRAFHFSTPFYLQRKFVSFFLSSILSPEDECLIIDNDIYGERFFCFPNKITSIVLLFLYLAGTNQVFDLILLTKNVVLISDYALPTHNVEIGNSQKLQAIWQKIMSQFDVFKSKRVKNAFESSIVINVPEQKTSTLR